ncbi:hypothetical protein GW17_00040701 [Ensete ventricosum]|nr:hypothetical protein GW17_00040701 [Ensete ventricosum]
MHQVDAVGNSPGVRRKLVEGIGSLPGWHKGVRQKKIETHRKIIGVAEKLTRSSDDAVGYRRKFARRFVEGIEKLAANAKGDCQEEDQRTCYKIVEGCQIMRKLDLI